MTRFSDFLFELLFPTRCLGCNRPKGRGNPRGFLCEDCRARIPVHDWLFCPACEKKLVGLTPCLTHQTTSHVKGLGVATSYELPLVKTLIWAFKYESIEALAETLGELVHTYFEKVFGDSSLGDFEIIPVPLHPRRERWRGFNQAELLAEDLSKRSALPLNKGLTRSRWQKPQTEIGARKARMKNIEGAFSLAHGASIKNKNVLLVDDVSTTGATLEEAARTLKAGGAKSVYGLVIARG